MLKNPKVKRPSWAQVLAMSDEEFAATFEASVSELAELQREVEQTSEVDIIDRNLFRYIGRLQGLEDKK